METRINEVAAGIYKLSTYFSKIAAPAGFTFNQYLLDDEEPLLFHCGMRGIFPSVSAAVRKIMPLERLRWIAFGHLEADECGAMNLWLEAAPEAKIMHGELGCAISLNDLAARKPRPLKDGEVTDLGGKQVRYLATPHVPHGWDAGLLYEETSNTLLCGDLFTQIGDAPALSEDDILGPAIEAEDLFGGPSALTPKAPATLRRLAELKPERLALMHGPVFRGDCTAALEGLAADFQHRLAREMEASPRAA